MSSPLIASTPNRRNPTLSRRLLDWSIPFTLLVIACTLQAAGLQSTLRYDRALVAAGEWWRLMTGNMVHLGWVHLLMDGTALILLWILFGDRYRLWQWCLIILIAMLSVGVGLYLFDPQTAWYVGLSGALHGVYAAGTVAEARNNPMRGSLFGLLLVGKLVREQLYGPAAVTVALIGGAVVVDAHLYGSIGGLVAGLMFALGKPAPGSSHAEPQLQRTGSA